MRLAKGHFGTINKVWSTALFMWLFVALSWVTSVRLYAVSNKPPAAPTGLLMELLSEPLGLENPNPSMSWIVNDSDADEYQSAYQILVSDCRDELAGGRGNLWDSGKVSSSESSNICYAGRTLKSNSVYFWKVRTWDKGDQPSSYSEPQRFSTALKEQLKAHPIWQDGVSAAEPNFLFLRTSLTLPNKAIRSAIAHVTALSPEPAAQYVYKLYMNGVFVGAGPQRGFNGTHRYNTFDVTRLLRLGQENVIGAVNYTKLDKRFLFQLTVVYADGSTQTVQSDRTWKTLDGDRVYRDLGNAGNRSFHYAPREGINAVQYPFGWNEPGFDDTAWGRAKEKDPIENLKASATLNSEMHLVKPVRIVNKGNNNYFVEFEKNVVAGIRLDVEGKAGHEVQLRLGEELSAPETIRDMRTGNTYREVWTLRDGRQVLENFGYRVFRYAEITNAPEGFNQDRIWAVVLRYPFDDQASSFSSSDPVLNDVWELCKYTIKGTLLDLYVDTHTRERRNYEGDTLVTQLSHYCLDREFALARYSAEYLYYRPTWPAEFKPQTIMMAWHDYLYTGNADSLRQHYEVFKEKKTFQAFINDEYLVEKPVDARGDYGRDLVDWPASQRDDYDFTTINTVINAFNCKAIEHLACIADVLNKKDEAKVYGDLAKKLRLAINEHLYDINTGRFKDGKTSSHYALHASAFPLALGLVEPDKTQSVADYVQSRGMVVSVYGAHFLLEGLYNAGRGQAALNLMNAKQGNSWGHLMYNLGATMACEAWDPTQKGNMSFSHPWASAPANAVCRGLFGIVPLEPAFSRFQIKPQPAALSWATLTVPTIKGPIRVELKKNENLFEMTVHVPVNTKAKVYVPIMNSNGFVVKKNDFPAEGVIENGYMVFPEVGSGRHVFQSSTVSGQADN